MQNKTWIYLISTVALILPLAGEVIADERKDLAFEVIDRNAQQMTDISDSIYYFGEIGMQEFEGSKLLKETLEAAGFRGALCGAGRSAGGAPARHRARRLFQGRGRGHLPAHRRQPQYPLRHRQLRGDQL